MNLDDARLIKDFLAAKAAVMRLQVQMRFKKEVTKQMYDDFVAAFTNLKSVYARASSNPNPWAQKEVAASKDVVDAIDGMLKGFDDEFVLNERGVYVRRDEL